jgi:hypothetical protein
MSVIGRRRVRIGLATGLGIVASYLVLLTFGVLTIALSPFSGGGQPLALALLAIVAMLTVATTVAAVKVWRRRDDVSAR